MWCKQMIPKEVTRCWPRVPRIPGISSGGRSFCNSGPSKGSTSLDITTSLSSPLKGLPSIGYAQEKEQEQDCQVTTLSNGLRVATQTKFGQFCTVGVAIDSGSRYEVLHPSGISHYLEKLAFNSTAKFKNREEILAEIEKYGGISDCQGSRDTLIYAASISTKGLDTMIDILSQVILHPNLTDEELEVARQTISFDLEDINRRPDQDPILLDMIHAAAFNSNTLGLPKLCPSANLNGQINKNTLQDYMKRYHTPDRMVLAGVGVSHDSLCEAAEKYFNSAEAKGSFLMSSSKKSPELSLSQYTGGLESSTKDLSNVSMGAQPIPELVHISIGLNSCSHQQLDDFIPTCVLNMMMGGGGSFSAGGPGKGMYTRLYTNVLNRYHWLYSATAYNHTYADGGLFCVNASCDPSHLRDMVGVIIKEMFDMVSQAPSEELARAKTQLKSMLLMNLEARPVVFEDVARQVLSKEMRRSPSFYMNLIDQVTAADITRVAERMVTSKPSVAALGDIKKLPSFDEFTDAFNSKHGRIPNKFKIFK